MTKNISNELFGHDKLLKDLIALYKKGRLPKILMLTGKKGIGKSTLIFHFLCNLTRPENYNVNKKTIINKDFIEKIFQNLNPNIFYINCENLNERKIDNIREIKEQISNSVMTGNSRYILIDDVELLNDNCSNALLKIIEEPSYSNYFILINNKSKKIIETIKSRCIEFKLFLNNSSKKEIINHLIEKEKINNIINLKTHDLSPGDFVSFNEIFTSNNIKLDENFLLNTDFLLQKYRLTKTEAFFNCAKYLIETYFFRKSYLDNKKIDFVNNLKSTIMNDLSKYKLFNLNHKIFIDNLTIQIKDVK